VPAKEIDLEYFAQGLGGQVFDSTGKPVRAVVEQRVQRAGGGAQNLGQTSGDSLFIGIIDKRAFKAFGSQAFSILGLSSGCKDPPAARL